MIACAASAAIMPLSASSALASTTAVCTPSSVDSIVVAPIPDQTFTVGAFVDLTISACSTTGLPLKYRASGLPAGLSVPDPNAPFIQGTPNTVSSGTAFVTVSDVTDGITGVGSSTEISFNFQVVAATSGGDVVTVQPIPNQIFTAGTPICPINVEATSSTNRSLGYHIAGQPGGVSIPNGSTGSHLITGTATAAPGGGTATVTVNDPDNITSTASFNYQVNNPSSDTLQPNSIMQQGGAIVSADGKYELTLQTDGNLVVYGNGIPVWSLGTTTGAVLANQCDGNLVLYNASGTALWASGTAGNGGSRLVMQNDGNLVLYRTSDGSPAWSSGSFCEPLTATDRLQSGQCLARGGVKLHSPDGRFTLWLQNDGNLVLYQDTTPLWSTGTSATSPTSGAEWLSNQNDGNLVLYNNGVVTSSSQALFNTGTFGNGQSTLILQNDGNLVLYRNSDGAATWASNTCCH